MSSAVISAENDVILDIELAKDLLKENRRLASEVKNRLDEQGIIAIDILGSIGSGKTAVIEAMVKLLKNKYDIGMIAGDIATTIDADRVKRHGIITIQINTGKECHLDANLVLKALKKMDLKTLHILFIENVGNLICPADYPLGAHKRVIVISVTEGDDMVVKHPLLFRDADILVINKIDLSDPMRVDPDKLINDAKMINPQIKAVKTNAREGIGINKLIEVLGL